MPASAIDLEDAFARAFAELRKTGLLLDSDQVLPSVARTLGCEIIRGSWWSHPLSNEIYVVGRRLAGHPDVLLVRLLKRKLTYVHRRHWSALYAVGTSREPWQLSNLGASARRLLSLVEKRGRLQVDELRSSRSLKALGDDARSLESSILVYGDDVHTTAGFHVKRLESWKHWASRVEFVPKRIDPSLAKENFEQLVQSMAEDSAATISALPWQTNLRRSKSRATR